MLERNEVSILEMTEPRSARQDGKPSLTRGLSGIRTTAKVNDILPGPPQVTVHEDHWDQQLHRDCARDPAEGNKSSWILAVPNLHYIKLQMAFMAERVVS